MLDKVVSLEALVVVLIVFGFMPGAALRLIVLAFPKDDPRRQELKAELYAVPRLERPFWVAEQIELALFEGLWGRFVRVASGRVIYRWHLRSGVKHHAKYPDTFLIPSEREKASLAPGMLVKLSFAMRHGGERMWVEVTEVNGRKLVGRLLNSPVQIPRLQHGDTVKFKPDHVLDIVEEPDPSTLDADTWKVEPICRCCAAQMNECNGDTSTS